MSVSKAVAAYRRQVQEARAGTGVRGLSFGIPALDRKTPKGMQPGQVISVAARTSIGKTAWVLHVIRHVCEDLLASGDARIVAVISAEMPETALVERLACAELEIPSEQVPYLAGEEQAAFEAELDAIAQWPLAIYDQRSPDLGDVKREVFNMSGGWKKTDGTPSPIALIVVDHIGKLRLLDKQGRPVESEYVTVSTVVDELYEMAGYFQAPLLQVVQVNRGVEQRIGRDRDGNPDVSMTRPLPSDMQGSGKAEQNSDMVILLWREERYLAMLEGREEKRGPMEMNVAKNRGGKVGVVYAPFNPDLAKLEVPVYVPFEIEDAVFEEEPEAVLA